MPSSWGCFGNQRKCRAPKVITLSLTNEGHLISNISIRLSLLLPMITFQSCCYPDGQILQWRQQRRKRSMAVGGRQRLMGILVFFPSRLNALHTSIASSPSCSGPLCCMVIALPGCHNSLLKPVSSSPSITELHPTCLEYPFKTSLLAPLHTLRSPKGVFDSHHMFCFSCPGLFICVLFPFPQICELA